MLKLVLFSFLIVSPNWAMAQHPILDISIFELAERQSQRQGLLPMAGFNDGQKEHVTRFLEGFANSSVRELILPKNYYKFVQGNIQRPGGEGEIYSARQWIRKTLATVGLSLNMAPDEIATFERNPSHPLFLDLTDPRVRLTTRVKESLARQEIYTLLDYARVKVAVDKNPVLQPVSNQTWRKVVPVLDKLLFGHGMAVMVPVAFPDATFADPEFESLSPETRAILESHGIRSKGRLTIMSEAEILQLRGMTFQASTEIWILLKNPKKELAKICRDFLDPEDSPLGDIRRETL